MLLLLPLPLLLLLPLVSMSLKGILLPELLQCVDDSQLLVRQHAEQPAGPCLSCNTTLVSCLLDGMLLASV